MSSLCSRLLVALVGFLLAVCASAVGSSRQAVSVSCAEAVYTTRAEAPPHAVQAVQIGPVIFNSLAHLTSRHGIDRPSRRLPFYTVKSPLTILASARRGVSISLVAGERNAAFVYDRFWMRRLADWHNSFAHVPRSVRLSLCRDATTKRLLDTQYAGGLLLRRLGCITIGGSGQRRRSSTPKNGPGRRAALLKGFAAVCQRRRNCLAGRS